MKSKELKKLNRAELLELLLEQTKKNEQLEKELKEARRELESRRIAIADSGSIAEASLRLTAIFEEAQKAADLYLANVKGEGAAAAPVRSESLKKGPDRNESPLESDKGRDRKRRPRRERISRDKDRSEGSKDADELIEVFELMADEEAFKLVSELEAEQDTNG